MDGDKIGMSLETVYDKQGLGRECLFGKMFSVQVQCSSPLLKSFQLGLF